MSARGAWRTPERMEAAAQRLLYNGRPRPAPAGDAGRDAAEERTSSTPRRESVVLWASRGRAVDDAGPPRVAKPHAGAAAGPSRPWQGTVRGEVASRAGVVRASAGPMGCVSGGGRDSVSEEEVEDNGGDSKAESVRILDLRGRGLVSIPPLRAFSWLGILNVSGNTLTCLCPLPLSLTFLDASSNKLDKLGDGLTALASLTSLSLSRNTFALLPSLPASLTSLDVSYNSITILPRSLPAKITTFNISHNNIESAASLAASLAACSSSLTSLSLAGNPLPPRPLPRSSFPCMISIDFDFELDDDSPKATTPPAPYERLQGGNRTLIMRCTWRAWRARVRLGRGAWRIAERRETRLVRTCWVVMSGDFVCRARRKGAFHEHWLYRRERRRWEMRRCFDGWVYASGAAVPDALRGLGLAIRRQRRVSFPPNKNFTDIQAMPRPGESKRGHITQG